MDTIELIIQIIEYLRYIVLGNMDKIENNKTVELLRLSVNEMSDIMLDIYIEWKEKQSSTPSDCGLQSKECLAYERWN